MMTKKFYPALCVDFSWYCDCGNEMIHADAHCGGAGYQDNYPIKCGECGRIWKVTVEAKLIQEYKFDEL